MITDHKCLHISLSFNLLNRPTLNLFLASHLFEMLAEEEWKTKREVLLQKKVGTQECVDDLSL